MIPISINKFADLTVKNNPGTNKTELIVSLNIGVRPHGQNLNKMEIKNEPY